MAFGRKNESPEEKKKEITSSLEELLPLPKDIINIIVPYFHINDLITLYTSDNPRTKEFALTEIKKELQKLATTIRPDIRETHTGKFREAFQKLYQESDQALARELISFFERLNIPTCSILYCRAETLGNPTVVTEFLTCLYYHDFFGSVPRQLYFFIEMLMTNFHPNPSTGAEVSENEKWARTISLFLARGADLNSVVMGEKKHDGAVTLLHRAIELNSVELVKLFIRFGSNLVEKSFDRQFFRSPPYKFVLDKKKKTEALLTQAEILFKAYGGKLHIRDKEYLCTGTTSKINIEDFTRLLQDPLPSSIKFIKQLHIENFTQFLRDRHPSFAEFIEQLINYSDLETAIRAWKIILKKCDSIIRVLEPLVRKKQEEEDARKAEESKREEKACKDTLFSINAFINELIVFLEDPHQNPARRWGFFRTAHYSLKEIFIMDLKNLKLRYGNDHSLAGGDVYFSSIMSVLSDYLFTLELERSTTYLPHLLRFVEEHHISSFILLQYRSYHSRRTHDSSALLKNMKDEILALYVKKEEKEKKEEKKTEAKEKEQNYGVQERNGIRIEIAREESVPQTADQMKLEEWRKREIEAEKDENEEKLKALRRMEIENRREIKYEVMPETKSEKKEAKEKNEKESSPNLKQEIDHFLIFVKEYKKIMHSISEKWITDMELRELMTELREKVEALEKKGATPLNPAFFSLSRREENSISNLITAIQQLDHRDEECEKRLNALKTQFLNLYNRNPKGNEIFLALDKDLTLPTLNIVIDNIVRSTVNDAITARWQVEPTLKNR